MIIQNLSTKTLIDLPSLEKIIYYTGVKLPLYQDVTYIVSGYTTFPDGGVQGGISYKATLQTIMSGVRLKCLNSDFELMSSTYATYINSSQDWQKIKPTYDIYNSLSANLNEAYTTLQSNSGKWICINNVYPINSIYISTENKNPKDILPGTNWIQFSQGRVLVGCGSTYDVLNSVGGCVDHTLTLNEIPSHDHPVTGSGVACKCAFSCENAGAKQPTCAVCITSDACEFTASAGGGTAHCNVQPYVVAYIWKRIS